MGISRDSRHKRRLTGGRRAVHKKKRKYEMGRPSSNTKMGSKRISIVRARGGNLKFRALRLDSGNFSWGSESVTRKARILDVVYNASNNELVRTKTLVKNAIVQIDATPYRQWYEQHYSTSLGGKDKKEKKDEKSDDKEKEKEKSSEKDKKKSKHTTRKYSSRNNGHSLEGTLKEQFASGRLYACISSRPGQSGRCDGYILEEHELDFYLKKITKKK